jgi:hypothetical protein
MSIEYQDRTYCSKCGLVLRQCSCVQGDPMTDRTGGVMDWASQHYTSRPPLLAQPEHWLRE